MNEEEKKIHIPVMLKEVIEFLDIKKDGIYLDLTIGAGGHSEEILKRIGDKGLLIGIDRDKKIIPIAEKRLQKISRNFKIYVSRYSQFDNILNSLNIKKIQGVLLDLGVSSYQLDTPERGFSFTKLGPLDMRMGEDTTLKAKEVVNNYSEYELANIFFKYGEEKKARKIGKAIVEYRKRKKIETTTELAQIITQIIPNNKKKKIHPATKVFQALRIFINKELEELSITLSKLPSFLSEKGRIIVISFHSLEDRIVKQFFKNNKEIFNILTKKPLTPSQEEILKNPRARSAKLRCVEKKE